MFIKREFYFSKQSLNNLPKLLDAISAFAAAAATLASAPASASTSV